MKNKKTRKHKRGTNPKRGTKPKKAGLIGKLRRHIMYRFLSEEDRIALEDIKGSHEPFIFPYSEISDSSKPFLIDHSDLVIKKKLKQIPSVKKKIDDLLKTLKEKKADRKQVKSQHDSVLSDIFNGSGLKDIFQVTVTMVPGYFPITCGDELMRQGITVNQYLTSDAWIGVRTTHGIHGFFTYDTMDISEKITSRPSYYEDYGFWEPSKHRATGGHGSGPKHLFIAKFDAQETEKGELTKGTFNEQFMRDNGSSMKPIFVDCSGGQGELPTGDKSGMISLGGDATCDEFEGAPEDGLKYARLGKLMIPSRPQEINFRGSGKIKGQHIKMNECKVVFDPKDISDEYLPVANHILDAINKHLDTDTNKRKKSFFREVHEVVIKTLE